MQANNSLDRYMVRQVSRRALRDERTVTKFLTGGRVAHVSREAIERALRDLGYTIPPRGPECDCLEVAERREAP